MSATHQTTPEQAPTPAAPYRKALLALEEKGIAPGSVIGKDELEQLFELPFATSVASFQRNTHLFRLYVWQLRRELMHKHRLVIRALPGLGYEVLEPQYQTSRVMRDRGEAIARELSKLADELAYLRTEELTDEQRKENLNAQAKVGALMSLSRKKLLPGSSNDSEAEIE